MIEVSHLTKDYGSHHALRDVSFTVSEGQIVGLLGPNGAGKSTTMNIMTGYLSATSGAVRIGGCDILEQPEKAKRQIGYLPEQPPLYDEMTVEEYLAFAAHLKGIRGRTACRAVLAEVEEAVKITEVKKRLIRNLSKGYRQRVGLAQALLGNPPLLILDEPTVGLDPNQIIEIRALIKSLAGKHTIVLSSHILPEVNSLCDYVLIIDQGRLVAEDTPERLSEHFSDHGRLGFSVKGERGAVEEALSACTFFKTFAVTEAEDGVCTVLAEAVGQEDVREELFYLFASRRLPILTMEMEGTSLEDAFIRLTGRDGEAIASEAQENVRRLGKMRRLLGRGRRGRREERKSDAEQMPEENEENRKEEKADGSNL